MTTPLIAPLIPLCESPASRGFTGYEHRDRAISSHARAVAAGRRVHPMTLPEGVIYRTGFLTEAEEREVLGLLATFELQPCVLHDTRSRRLVRSFGLALVTGGDDAGPAAPVPGGLGWLRERCPGLTFRTLWHAAAGPR